MIILTDEELAAIVAFANEADKPDGLTAWGPKLNAITVAARSIRDRQQELENPMTHTKLDNTKQQATMLVTFLRALDKPSLQALHEDLTVQRDNERKYIGHAKTDDEQARQRDKVMLFTSLIGLTQATLDEKTA